MMKRPSFIFEENHLSIEEDKPSDLFVTIEKELDAVEVDGVGNLVDLPRLMFIDYECGVLKVVVDGG